MSCPLPFLTMEIEMRVTYKIIHPSHVKNWVAVHAVGKIVRRVPLREEGQGDVPVMSAADYDNDCVILAVEEKSRRADR